MPRLIACLVVLLGGTALLSAAEPPTCVPWRPQYLCQGAEYCCKPLPPVDCDYCTSGACYDGKPLPCWGLNFRCYDDCYTRKPAPCRLPTPLCPGYCEEHRRPFSLYR